MTAIEILRAVPLFAEVGEDDLARIAAQTRVEEVAAGSVVIREGTPPDALFLVDRGELVVTKQSGGTEMVLNTCGPGDLLGELSVLEGRPRTATITARSDARLLRIDVAAIDDLLRASPGAARAILRTMATRLGNTEAVLRQHDTLAGLGRIAAGLAHELNNPASAVARGAAELDARLRACDAAVIALAAAGLDPGQLARVRALAEQIDPGATVETTLGRARREQALEAALARHGIDAPWEHAPALAALGWNATTADELVATLPAATVPAALHWIAATASTRAIARDLADATTRISELVAAVRSHSHLGEAPIQEVDVHAGLDSTLALFRHQLGQVRVRRDYGELPRIAAYGGELNQVWTNLIDNALHAMGGRGELVVVTRCDRDDVVIDVIDSGPGIPAENLPEIWKPFFTTKPVGEGTGLGLHLARNVVVQRHRGAIDVESRPGRTCFRVRLPIAAS